MPTKLQTEDGTVTINTWFYINKKTYKYIFSMGTVEKNEHTGNLNLCL